MELTNYETTQEELDALNKKIIEDLDEAIGDINHPILLILQSHLFIEHLLERYIIAELPRGKKLIEKGNLTFYQKVRVTDSFGVFERQIIDALIKLNSLRNDLSHEFRHQIEKEQVELIGSTLGKVYSEIKNEADGCLVCEIFKIVHHIIGVVACNTYIAENLPKKNS